MKTLETGDMIYSNSSNIVYINSGTPFTDIVKDVISQIQDKLDSIDNDIADIVLLTYIPKKTNVYELSCEEQIYLPYRSRL